MNDNLRNIILKIQNHFNDYDKKLIQKANSSFDSDKYRPIFIIGPPRSGSTLLFQLITSNIQSVYFSNLMALFPKYLYHTSKISKEHFFKTSEIKKNHYGYIKGIHSPNEGGKMFGKWFDQDGISKKNEIRYIFRGLSNYFKLPVVAKPMTLINKLHIIYEIIPEIRFLVIRRNELMNAQSLIVARKFINKDVNKWWSTKPKCYQTIINKDPFYQVFWQIQKVYSLIDDFIQKRNLDYLYLSYEEICRTPIEILSNIIDKFNLDLKSNTLDKSNIRGIYLNDQQKLSSIEWEKLNYYYKLFH